MEPVAAGLYDCPTKVNRPYYNSASAQALKRFRGCTREEGEMVNPAEIEAAIAAHELWEQRLRRCVASGLCKVSLAVVRADDQCALGLWLYGPTLSAVEKSEEPYRAVRRLHAQVHQRAADALEQLTASGQAAADRLLGVDSAYGRASRSLLRTLRDWKDCAVSV